MSDLPAEEVELIEDPEEVHKIYKQSFIDEQVKDHPDINITTLTGKQYH